MEMEREPELTDVFTALFGEPEVIEGVGLAYSLKHPDTEAKVDVMVEKIKNEDIHEIADTCGYNNNYPEWVVMLTDLINGDLSLDDLRKDIVEAYYNGGFCFLAYETIRDDKGVFIKEVPKEPYSSRYLRQKP